MGYIDQDGTYYEGDRISEDDLVVPARPSPFHDWVDGAWVVSAEKHNAHASTLRAIAYKEEADPLFFKQARGEVEPGAWEAKVAEIRARYPKV